MAVATLSTRFQSLPLLPTIKLGPSGAGSGVGGLVHNDLSCEAGSLSCCRPNPHRRFQSEVCGFISAPPPPALEPGVARSALLPAVCPVYLCVNVGPRGVTCRSACPVLRHSESSATLSPALSVYLCRNVGPRVLLVVRLPALLVPHSASLGPARATQVLSAGCPSPPLLLVWMNVSFFISLVSDFLAIWFSVSSGCARRRSVSTYAAILVLLLD